MDFDGNSSRCFFRFDSYVWYHCHDRHEEHDALTVDEPIVRSGGRTRCLLLGRDKQTLSCPFLVGEKSSIRSCWSILNAVSLFLITSSWIESNRIAMIFELRIFKWEGFFRCFRVILLSISMSWILVIVGIMGAVYKFRRLKVFRVASPVFLCITLLGCAIMYAEVRSL